MNNRKGFTLIELLVTITIIGIIMIMTLPAIHNLQRENQKKKFDDYERAVLEAAKAYEDQYEEDLFGRSDTGCASINYEDLVNKKLLTTTKIAGYECNNDKNGIIIRKVKGTSYYEVYLTCNKGTNDKKNLTENTDDYTDIRDHHCNTGEDHDAPTLSIKCDGNNYDHAIIGDDGNKYYGAILLPELTVRISDDIAGLEKNQYVTYEWKIYNQAGNISSSIPNKIEKNKTTFNTKDGAGSTAKKKVRIIDEFKRANTTGKAVVDLSGDNIIDRAGNKLSLDVASAKEKCTYYYDNTPPKMEIKITGNNTGKNYNINSNAWINEPITTTVTVTDKTTNGIYSGIEPTSLTRGNVNEPLSGGTDTYSFSRNDSNRDEKEEYKVCDKVGNCTSQIVNIRVDTTYPTCKSRGGDPNWRSTSLTIYGKCDDPGDSKSECRKDEYNKTYSDEITITTGTAGEACDNAGNCVMCSEDQEVHIDKSPPQCALNATTGQKQPNKPVTISASCYETNGSIVDRVEWNPNNISYMKDISYESYTLDAITSEPRTYTFVCYNKAGLSCSVSTTIKVSTCVVHRVYSTGNYCNNNLCSCVSCSKGSVYKTSQWVSGDLCHTYWNCEGDETVTTGWDCGYEEA